MYLNKMEKTLCMVIVLLVVAESVIAKDDDDELACCPSSLLLYYVNRSVACYDPIKKITTPTRVVCHLLIQSSNFSVKSGMIEFQITDLYKKTFGSDQGCYGSFKNLSNPEEPFRNVSFLCIDKEERQLSAMRYCVIVSVICLSITTLIYVFFFELRDLFGKSVINYCGSLAIALGLLCLDPKVMFYCALRGFSAYFFLVASFFWSNSISIQLLRDTRRPASVDYGWKEFRWYVLYSWGSPTVLTTITAIVNYYPGDHQKPGIGLDKCWFLNGEQEWYYLNSVLMILFVINVAIFIYIATMFWRFAVKSTHMKTLKYKFSMTIRLIVLMGLPWIFKMINLVAGGTSLTWFVLETISALQGLLVFLVLVARKRVVKVLHQRGLLVCCARPVESWLAAGEDETNGDQPTDVFLREHNQTDGYTH